jgi:hypothetical protein
LPPVFNPEDGDDMFLRNVGLSPDCLSLQPSSANLQLGLVFYPKDGGNMFVRNVGMSPNCAP